MLTGQQLGEQEPLSQIDQAYMYIERVEHRSQVYNIVKGRVPWSGYVIARREVARAWTRQKAEDTDEVVCNSDMNIEARDLSNFQATIYIRTSSLGARCSYIIFIQ